jgi:hypothetical protein
VISSILRIAVIPTRDRPQKYAAAVKAISTQVDYLVTVGHHRPLYAVGDRIVRYEDEPANISTMWNLGLSAAAKLAGDRGHLIAVMNDDTIPNSDWFQLIQDRMQAEHTVLGSGRRGNREARKTQLAGHAFVVRGGTIKANPAYAWWVSDDWLEKEAREKWGGVSIVDEAIVKHSHENLPKDHPLQVQSERDLRDWEKQIGHSV